MLVRQARKREENKMARKMGKGPTGARTVALAVGSPGLITKAVGNAFVHNEYWKTKARRKK